MSLLNTVFLGLIVFLVIAIVVLWLRNSKLKEEANRIKEILKIKDKTIENLEASRLNVKDVLEDIARMQEVIESIEKGESKRVIADRFGIPLSRVEFIIKLELKKRT